MPSIPPVSMLHPGSRTQSMPCSDSAWSRRGQLLPSLSWKKALDIDIILDGEQEFIHSYSTYDEISGHVKLRFEKDTCIDELTITFQGQTNTWVEKVATASPTMGRATGKHTFVRVQQPIDERCLPEYNKALAGVTYSIPFTFVVPDKILDFACNHRIDHGHIRDCHLCMPPSIGDPMLSGQSNTLMDDLAPSMSKISYAIQVRLIKALPNVRKPEIIQEEKGIRIIPAREEAPPLTIDMPPNHRSGQYCLRKEKNVRKGILNIGKKQGRLTAEAQQPPSLKLHHPSDRNEEPITTMATVQLRYDPASADEQPPTLSGVTNKMKVYTYYGAAPWAYSPAPEAYDIYSTLHSQYPETVELSTRNLRNVEWIKHEPGMVKPSAPASTSQHVPSAAGRRPSKSLNTSIPINYSAGAYSSASTHGSNLLRRTSTFSTTSSTSNSDTSENESSSSFTNSNASSSTDLAKNTSIPLPSESYDASLPYYTTSIVVPVTLPTYTSSSYLSSSTATSTTTSPAQSRRASSINPSSLPTISTSTTTISAKPMRKSKPVTFLPTFHSCLVSRIYTLDFAISAQSAPTLNLKVPIQLSLPYNTPRTQNPTAPSTQGIPQAWFDPFSASPIDTDTDSLTREQQQIDLANDEAIARALSSVPEYELVQTTNPISPAVAARHASLPVLDGIPPMRPDTDEAPPDYSSSLNRYYVPRPRRSRGSAAASAIAGVVANMHSAGLNGSSSSSAATAAAAGGSTPRGNAEERRGSANNTEASNPKGDGRRRFSLLH